MKEYVLLWSFLFFFLQKTCAMLIWYKQSNSKKDQGSNTGFLVFWGVSFGCHFIHQWIWVVQGTIPSTQLQLTTSPVSAVERTRTFNNGAAISLLTNKKASSELTVSPWTLPIQFCLRLPEVSLVSCTSYLPEQRISGPTLPVSCWSGWLGKKWTPSRKPCWSSVPRLWHPERTAEGLTGPHQVTTELGIFWRQETRKSHGRKGILI